MLKTKTHRYFYLFSLCLLVTSVSVSEYVTSITIWLLLTNWLFEGKFKEKLIRLKQDKTISIFLILYIVPVIWLLNTVNFDFAFNDLRIKLPLLVFPIIIGTTKMLNTKELLIIFRCFFLGLLISTISGVLAYHGIFKYKDIENFRHISVFISHIRLALMLCLAIFLIVYLLDKNLLKHKIEKIFSVLIAVWFFIFLFIIQAFTGFVILFTVGFILLIIKQRTLKSLLHKRIIGAIVILLPLAAIIYFSLFIKDFYTPTPAFDENRNKTSYGNLYYNDYDSRLLENGNYIYRHINEEELYREWAKRSQMSLDSVNSSGQEMVHILLRYMTSKGLSKDAEGIKALTDEDIIAIQSGSTNYRFNNNSFITKRLYSILWQMDVYLKGGNPSGHSITQRFEFIKAALILAHQNFWLGTGTGDLDDEYKRHYIETRSILEPDFRHRAHNQYLTFFICFGVFGALLCFIAVFLPIIINRAHKNYYFMVFFCIALISMLNEDTIETMIGVIFFSFFYSLFMWGYQTDHQKEMILNNSQAANTVTNEEDGE